MKPIKCPHCKQPLTLKSLQALETTSVTYNLLLKSNSIVLDEISSKGSCLLICSNCKTELNLFKTDLELTKYLKSLQEEK